MPREKWRQLNSQSRADTTISIFEFVYFLCSLKRRQDGKQQADAPSKLADYKKPLSLAFSAINLGIHLNYFVMMYKIFISGCGASGVAGIKSARREIETMGRIG